MKKLLLVLLLSGCTTNNYMSGVYAGAVAANELSSLVHGPVPVVTQPVLVQPMVMPNVYIPKPVNYVPGQYTEACIFYGYTAKIYDVYGKVIGWRYCD